VVSEEDDMDADESEDSDDHPKADVNGRAAWKTIVDMVFLS
jgi:hypothetical protein